MAGHLSVRRRQRSRRCGDELGDGVDQFAVGDEVLGFSLQRSSQATHVAVPTDS